ncbi:hypothetical protein GQ53DRAFT_773639 [Thozetella sp. PMI_491]|nr:hypothetical protein GQ53DRAFT_773639 [Thozetella sp. PMI_491]
MGDSYSAGPGAGKNYDNIKYGGNPCYRGTGAYPPQLNALRIGELGTFQFLSCTGHVTKDVVQYQIPDITWGNPNSTMHVTMSIGGNDLMFSSYIMACLMGIKGDCKSVLGSILNLLNDVDNKHTLKNSLYSVWSRLQKSEGGGAHTVPKILQTLYPKMFNANTTSCDEWHISWISIFSGPRMSQQLRKQTNDLISLANERIANFAREFQNAKANYQFMGKLDTLDYNPDFDGHRMCEPFATKNVGFDDSRCWFFGIGSPDSVKKRATSGFQGIDYDQVDPKTCNPEAADLGEAFACVIANYKFANPSVELDDDDLPEFVTQAFHPKTAGFAKVRDAISNKWFGLRPALRVLNMGGINMSPNATKSSKPDTGSFYKLVSQEYKMDMVNTVGSGDKGQDHATIQQISEAADAVLTKRPNVVLLYAGQADMAGDASASGAVNRLISLVNKILQKAPDATVLVAKLGASTDEVIQRRIETFNQALESQVASLRDSGEHVQLMHMDAVLTKDYLSDGSSPNEEGYSRMAAHWLGGVQYANNQGWIQEPVNLAKEVK